MDKDNEENNARSNSGRVSSKHQKLILPDLKAQLIFWPLVILGTALDLWSKKAVFDRVEQHGNIPIIDGVLRFVMALNNGAAFGFLAGHPYKLIVVSVVALIVVLVFFLFFSGTMPRPVHIALGFFAAGVCGNLYDRIFNDGLVRDFIDITFWPGKHWPAFNVADSMLCIAVGLWIISCFQTSKHSS